MRSAFLRMLWSARKPEPSSSLQEKTAAYSMYPRRRSVMAAPKDPPIRRGGGFRNG